MENEINSLNHMCNTGRERHIYHASHLIFTIFGTSVKASGSGALVLAALASCAVSQ